MTRKQNKAQYIVRLPFYDGARRQLGVWYTPREITRYQVALVDRLLHEALGKPLELAFGNALANQMLSAPFC